MRLSIDQVKYGEMKESIRTRGIKFNVLARPDPKKEGKKQIYAGRLRLRIAQELKAEGLDIKIPAMIEDVDDKECFVMTLKENQDRMGMSAYDIGNWLQMMQITFGLTQRNLAELVGYSPAWVNRHLKIVEEIQSRQEAKGFDESLFNTMTSTERQARALRSLDTETRQQVFKSVEEGKVPSARSMERMRNLTATPEEVLARYKPFQVEDEFMIYLLQEEAGLTISEAKERVLKWRFGKKKRLIDPKISPTDAVVKLYRELSKYYPIEIIDEVEKIAPAKTLETMVKSCRRYAAKLYAGAPLELRQSILQEWMM